jgi:hypothetical protein
LLRGSVDRLLSEANALHAQLLPCSLDAVVRSLSPRAATASIGGPEAVEGEEANQAASAVTAWIKAPHELMQDRASAPVDGTAEPLAVVAKLIASDNDPAGAAKGAAPTANDPIDGQK